MWKDFFYYSKGERRTVLLLLIVIFVASGILCVLSYIKEVPENTSRESFEEMERFLASVHKLEKENASQHTWRKLEKPEPKLIPFEPNLADSIEFVRLGLPPYVAHNIIRYRHAGGKFTTPDAFAKIYGMKEEWFSKLKPYIYISEAYQKKQDSTRYAKGVKRDTLKIYKYPEGTLVDLNSADTTELKKIPGIGSGIARTIVTYRERLGGFYELAQLNEIEYITSDIKRWFKLGNVPIHRINANKAGLDKLRLHPYMNFYKAKVIVEYRKKKGKLKSLSQLALYEEFTEKDLERLSHYLEFN